MTEKEWETGGGKKGALEECERKMKKLLYEWEKVYAYGDTESMCTDGIVLNRYRTEMMDLKNCLEILGSYVQYEIPPQMPKAYMAQEEIIRAQAEKASREYAASEEYRYLMTKFFHLSEKQRETTGLAEVYGKVQKLLDAVSEDNLVVMRELGTPGMLREQIRESAKKVRSVPLKSMEPVKRQQSKQDENWQIQGQLNIYDLMVS